MNFLDIDGLRIIKEIAKTQSISRTAKNLGYVQSNITSRLRGMEEEFQTKLFLRSNKGVKILPEGEKFLAYANDILAIHQEMQVVFGKDQKSRVGITQIINRNRFVSDFFFDHAASLELFTFDIDELVDLLDQGELDFIIMDAPCDDQRVDMVNSFPEQLCWSYNESVDFPNCKNILINRDSKCPYRKEIFKQLDLTKEYNFIEVDTISILINLLANKEAVTILPTSVSEVSKMESSPLVEASDPHFVYVAYKKNNPLISTKSIDIMSLLKEYAELEKKGIKKSDVDNRFS